MPMKTAARFGYEGKFWRARGSASAIHPRINASKLQRTSCISPRSPDPAESASRASSGDKTGWMSGSGRVEHLKDEGSRLQVVASGSVAGLVSRFCIAPLDVVKIRLQLQIHSLADPLNRPQLRHVYQGAFGTFNSIVKTEGVTGLWKGNIPAELLYLTYGGVQFSTYRFTNVLFKGLPSNKRLPGEAENFISGAVAGGMATTVTYPLDLLRTRFAAQGVDRVYSGMLESIRNITMQEGTKGFFRGWAAAMVQVVPYMGLFFASYETLKVEFAEYSLPFGAGDGCASFLGSVGSKTVVYPLDTIRKRLQVQGPNRSRYARQNIPLYRGLWGTLKAIWKREGVRGFYKGVAVSWVKAGAVGTITMWTYERTMAALRVLDGPEDA